MRAIREVAGIVECLAAAAVLLLPRASDAQSAPSASKTQVVLLGTGTPLPDPERAGPSYRHLSACDHRPMREAFEATT